MARTPTVRVERRVLAPSLPERISQRRFYILGFGGLMAILIAVTLAVLAVLPASPAQTTSDQPGVSIGPAPVNNAPVQDPVVNVPDSTTIPLYEAGWMQVEGPFASFVNPRQQNLLAVEETERVRIIDWFREEVWPGIQADPGFLNPETQKDGSPAVFGKFTGLVADGNVWVASIATFTCVREPCLGGIRSGVTENFHLTDRLFVSFDAGETWRELVPPPGYRNGNFMLVRDGAMIVSNEENAARVIVFVFQGPVYQTAVPAKSPPER